MKKQFLAILCFFGSGFLHSQNCDTIAVKKLLAKAKELITTDVNECGKVSVAAYEKTIACPYTTYYYESLILLGKSLYQLDRPDSNIRLIQSALKNVPENIPLKYKAKLYHQLSSASAMLLKLEDALKYGLTALKIYEETKNKTGAANILVNIANVYQQQYNFKQAEKTLKQALVVASGDSAVLGNVYNSIGILYAEHQQLDSAEKYLLRSTVIREALNDFTSIVWNYNNLGGVYTLKRQPEKAKEYFNRAYKKFEGDSNYYGMSSVLLNLGEVSMQLHDSKRALDYYLKARSLAQVTGDMDNLENIYTNLSNYYDAMNDLKTAFKYSDSLIVLKDTIYGKKLDRSMAEMQTKFDVEKKDLEIAANKAELKVKEEESFIKNVIIVSIILFIILASVAVFLFYRKKQVEQKARHYAEIAAQKEVRTKAIIEAEEKERRRIAQDLHDGVGQILSAAKLNLSSFISKTSFKNEEEKNALQNAVGLIDDSVKEVRAVSHNMMPNTLIKLGLASAVREFITKIGNIPNLKVDLEIVGLDKRLDEQLETVLYRVSQEIVNNIIKHSKANHIGMQIIKHEDEVTVMIEDNGIGFDTSKIADFTGIGLKNIISRIEFLNGTVHFDSRPGHGTNVIIEVPLA